MTKYKCDIKDCNKTATRFYYKGYSMGYYYDDMLKKDCGRKRGEKKKWLKLCDDCNIHREYLKLINEIEESRKQTAKLIKEAKKLFNL